LPLASLGPVAPTRASGASRPTNWKPDELHGSTGQQRSAAEASMASNSGREWRLDRDPCVVDERIDSLRGL
jgi:hypothetical protein